MGKLIERIERMQKSGGARLGFGTSSNAKQVQLLLIGALTKNDAHLASSAAAAGADGLYGVQGAVPHAPGIPVGATLAGADVPGGADFVVVELKSPAAAAANKDGFDAVLKLDGEIPDGLLRTLEPLPVDAFLMQSPPAPIAFEALMDLLKVTRTTNKPVFAHVASGTDSATLVLLRDIGIVGVVVDVGSQKDVESLGALRKTLNALPEKKVKKARSRDSAMVRFPSEAPSGSPIREPEGPPDEDDDDDDR